MMKAKHRKTKDEGETKKKRKAWKGLAQEETVRKFKRKRT